MGFFFGLKNTPPAVRDAQEYKVRTTQFTCFTGTTVPILTQLEAQRKGRDGSGGAVQGGDESDRVGP